MARYVVIYEHQGKSWSASSPDLPKVFAVGCRSRAEARKAMSLGIELHLQALKEAGQSVPTPRHQAGIVTPRQPRLTRSRLARNNAA